MEKIIIFPKTSNKHHSDLQLHIGFKGLYPLNKAEA